MTHINKKKTRKKEAKKKRISERKYTWGLEGVVWRRQRERERDYKGNLSIYR